jgi:hypothetical protein
MWLTADDLFCACDYCDFTRSGLAYGLKNSFKNIGLHEKKYSLNFKTKIIAGSKRNAVSITPELNHFEEKITEINMINRLHEQAIGLLEYKLMNLLQRKHKE